jgi:tRNA (Thr-GGU) A37 N-methylase
MDDQIIYKPIGIIHTPFKEAKKMPIQPAAAKGIKGTVDIKPYVPEFDDQKAERIGWLSDKIDKMREIKTDERFK